MKMPEISIIVPVYNTEKWLRRCVDSILAQTFKDFELLLIETAVQTIRALSAMNMLGKTLA